MLILAEVCSHLDGDTHWVYSCKQRLTPAFLVSKGEYTISSC